MSRVLAADGVAKPRKTVGLLSVASFLVVWSVVSHFEVVNPLFISSPVDVTVSGWNMVAEGALVEHAPPSLRALTYGFLAAVAFGVPVGMLLGQLRRLNMLAHPFVMIGFFTPRSVLLPLLLIWLGLGTVVTSIIVFLGGVFPILITTLAGIRDIDESWLRVARSFGATRFGAFRKVVFPGVAPHIVTGLRLGFARAVLGVVIAEMYASSEGVGHLVMRYGASFQTGRLLFLIVLIGGFGSLCISILHAVSRKLLVWHPSSG